MEQDTISDKGVSSLYYTRLWLLILLALVFFMVIIGGLTRLTDSGLSITEWKPLTGAIPPVTDNGWEEEFRKYSMIPEFKLQNHSMTLSEFKVIYWWEWGHRQLGRVIGLVWFLGFSLLWYYKCFDKEPIAPSFLIGCLIGVQGGIGWWMVSSGLEDNMLDVKSYRLAIHLLTAFIILSILYWRVYGLTYRAQILPYKPIHGKALSIVSIIILVFLYMQIVSGALVAGIDAGTAYNEWPLMNGQVLPSESFDLSPVWLNILDNSALVQFNHRYLGYILFLLVLGFFLITKLEGHKTVRRSGNILVVVATLQVVLGIITILSEANLYFAALHQIGGMIFLFASLNSVFISRQTHEFKDIN